MISYCVACGRPELARVLLADLVAKTSVPFELVLWLNSADPGLAEIVERLSRQKVPVRVVGSTPADIGMMAYRILFEHAKYEMVAQVEDNVVCVSRGIAEKAAEVFRQCPKVRQLVADVVQDRFTDGARPPMDRYEPYENVVGLYDGPVDGWFSVYHRSALPLLYEAPYERHFFLGSWAKGKLASEGLRGLLYSNIRVFHASGPAYARLFGVLEAEVRRLRAHGRADIADLYASGSATKEDLRGMAKRYEEIRRELDKF